MVAMVALAPKLHSSFLLSQMVTIVDLKLAKGPVCIVSHGMGQASQRHVLLQEISRKAIFYPAVPQR